VWDSERRIKGLLLSGLARKERSKAKKGALVLGEERDKGTAHRALMLAGVCGGRTVRS
jgi:hypothetical protein